MTTSELIELALKALPIALAVGGVVTGTVSLIKQDRTDRRNAALVKKKADDDAAKAEADLAVIYEGMARRANEDAITKDNRLRALECELAADRVRREEDAKVLKLQLEQLTLDIIILKREKEALIAENVTLSERVRKLESILDSKQIPY